MPCRSRKGFQQSIRAGMFLCKNVPVFFCPYGSSWEKEPVFMVLEEKYVQFINESKKNTKNIYKIYNINLTK